jgi:hypothetical protein
MIVAKKYYQSQHEKRDAGLPPDACRIRRAVVDDVEVERRAFDRKLDFAPVASVFPLKSRPQER